MIVIIVHCRGRRPPISYEYDNPLTLYPCRSYHTVILLSELPHSPSFLKNLFSNPKSIINHQSINRTHSKLYYTDNICIKIYKVIYILFIDKYVRYGRRSYEFIYYCTCLLTIWSLLYTVYVILRNRDTTSTRLYCSPVTLYRIRKYLLDLLSQHRERERA